MRLIPVRRIDWVLTSVRLAFAIVFFTGCGRSSLDLDLPAFDGGAHEAGPYRLDSGTSTDAAADGGGACGPATCPNGCCDSSGTCRSGTDLQACGSFGEACADCPSAGFDFCDARAHACGRTVLACDANSCADGCCNGNTCLSGVEASACGSGGGACQNCTGSGQTCDATSRTCTGSCTAANCQGCCVGDLCQPGTIDTACGRNAQQCQNCAAQGIACQPMAPGGACEGQPACGPGTCAGCCLGNVCVVGTDNSACGLAGAQCQSCSAPETCQSGANGGGFCAPPTCGPGTCKGCCVGNTCLPGTTDVECGLGGGQCQLCANGQTCTGGKCAGTTLCGPQNCASGCCVGDICAQGTQDTVCGTGGLACANCQAQNEVCRAGACVQTCSPKNCNGCCQGDTCVGGGADAACGTGGQACADCTQLPGEVCRAGVCAPATPPCSKATCPGCCDATGACQPGFLSTSCGSGGAACTNCNAQKSTCDVSITPRVCMSQQTTCPAPYPSCSASVTTPPPPVQHVCTGTDLQNARAACAGGPASAGCQQYFQFEQQVNPACASCLAPFDVAFSDATGIFACVAPFVSPSCDHTTGCIVDCVETSCGQCPSGGFAQCRSDVLSGACRTYVNGAQCIAQALFGAGAFCNPGAYQGSFGGWLQGVGGHYCGP